MLREIRIANLALIESLQIEMTPGLTVLTGETGAGKSIILQAIHLLSGGRASSDWIRTGTDSVSVEALFDITGEDSGIDNDIKEMGIECNGELVIRRNITSGGKSKFYINGSLVTAKNVGSIAENLLSVASQHDHQHLLDPGYQLDFIDAVGGLWAEREEFGKFFDQWKKMARELVDLKTKELEKEQRRDFLAFQCKEIDDAKIVDGEDEELEREKDRLKASEDLMRLGSESFEILQDPVISALSQLRRNADRMAAFDKTLVGFSEKIASHSYEIEDLAAELRSYIENIPTDQSQLDMVLIRIDLLQRLKRKYGSTLEEIVVFGEKAQKELDEIDALDERLAGLEKEVAALEAELIRKATFLSKSRKDVAASLEKKVSDELNSLSFNQAMFSVQFDGDEGKTLAEIGHNGWDKPKFMFSANPGEPVKLLAKIASGGELSRLMLALKCILAKKDRVKTVIFDEVDAGISGKAAEAVARKIKELAGHHQVLCITHLPQIASFANEHFLVAKNVSGERTVTTISLLETGKRAEELARMLDGDSVTPRTLAYATELIERNN